MTQARVDYHTYMASREWRLKRKEVINRYRDGLCYRCISAPIEQVHHLTYEHLGNEDLDDLQGLCRPCHEYVSAERDEDPAVVAVLALIEKTGLHPILRKDGDWNSFMYWDTGPNEFDRYFCVEFKTTDQIDDDEGWNHPVIAIPLRDGVWLHFWWM